MSDGYLSWTREAQAAWNYALSLPPGQIPAVLRCVHCHRYPRTDALHCADCARRFAAEEAEWAAPIFVDTEAAKR